MDTGKLKFPRANENLFEVGNYDWNPIEKQELREHILKNTTKACADLLEALQIGLDHNTQGTAYRMAKMFVDEVFHGRYSDRPSLTFFPNYNNIDQIYTIGPVSVRSTCSHHFVPIIGKAWFGVFPNADTRMLGLSKFARLADWIFARPQIQEEATDQLGELIETYMKMDGLAIVVKAQHFCTAWRGIKENEQTMVTSYMRGIFKEDAKARAEFFELIKGQGY